MEINLYHSIHTRIPRTLDKMDTMTIEQIDGLKMWQLDEGNEKGNIIPKYTINTYKKRVNELSVYKKRV